jgi:fructokinase
MIVAIGEILFDVFPDGRRIGGAPFNFAYHLGKLNLPTRFISRVGRDEPGETIAAFLSAAGFDAADLQVDAERPTGRVEVTLDSRKRHQFTIVPDVAYDALDLGALETQLRATPARLIYFGSLAQRTRRGFETVHRLLSGIPRETLRLYDMNLRPGAQSKTIVIASLEHADILKLNDSELEKTASFLGRGGGEAELIEWIRERFALKMVALTRGDKGATLYTPAGRIDARAMDVATLADTVGAGDAFCAVLAAGVLLDWPAERILREAIRFSAQICSVSGAIPASDDAYQALRTLVGGKCYE